MEKLLLTELSKDAVNSIRADWVEQIDEDDDSSLEIVDSYFDHLMTTDSFGDLLKRSNQTTYMAVKSESGDVFAIADIIFVRQGARTRCKIMDITHAPQVDGLDDETYEETTFSILISVLARMMSINDLTRHGITKIYARTESLQVAIDRLHESMTEGNNKDGLHKLGFTVKKSGRLWLEFEKKAK